VTLVSHTRTWNCATTASVGQGRVPQACAMPHCAPIRWLQWFTETSAVLPCPARVTCVSMCARPTLLVSCLFSWLRHVLLSAIDYFQLAKEFLSFTKPEIHHCIAKASFNLSLSILSPRKVDPLRGPSASVTLPLQRTFQSSSPVVLKLFSRAALLVQAKEFEIP
jgi:hypothetical protein